MRRKDQSIPQEFLEAEYRTAGHELICGIDEVGRGAWAGPLVVGAVILPPNRQILSLRDSKLLNQSDREIIARRLKKIAISWSIGVVEVAELNQIGLGAGLGLAAERAVAGLKIKPSIVLTDGKYLFRGLTILQQPVIRGDQTVRTIAAASVIAKVARDQMLRTLHHADSTIRRYRFDLNKGYPSPLHKAQLRQSGPSIHHRLTFRPIQESLTQSLFSTVSG